MKISNQVFYFVTLAILFAALPGFSQAVISASEADSFYQKKDWGNAASAYQKLTEQEPAHPRNWYRLGVTLHAQNKFEAAIAAYQKAESISHAPAAMYNLACSYARLNNKDKAFAWLDQAATPGYPQIKQFQADTDLVSLRDDPRFQALAKKIERINKPCAFLPEARQFDFWLGDWDVKGINGQPAGTNSVQQILGDCVVYENWTDMVGNSGKSINVYNQAKSKWQQTWVDDKGGVTEYVNGEFKDGAMRFTTQRKDQAGNIILGKLTFYSLDKDKVRQHGEESTDDGKTWTTQYDLTYYRKKPTGQEKQE